MVLEGEGKLGKIYYCPVGATNVGSIKIGKLENFWNKSKKKFERNLNWEKQEKPVMKQGEEVGMFKMGSTIVMIVEVPKKFRFEDLLGKKVRYGQILGKVDSN